ncbi:MAG TPA: DUF1761 domain-containing protein [Parcubacteria group bacterium]|jgi:hypothetical protein|nr:DUF1761 domain-containing protein [Parcubacteria group bacterium]
MLSIILASVLAFVFGAFWFTVLFGKKWAKLMDFNPASEEKYKNMGMKKPLVLNFLSNLLIVGVVYWLAPQLLTSGYFDLWKMLLVVWLGFSFPIYANAGIWERKDWKLVWINSAQSLIALTLISAVIYFI